LLGEAATLPVGGFGALSPWNGLAFFLLHSFTLPLLDVIAFLLGNILALLLGCISALLGGHIAALLGVSNLLTDLFGHWVALPSINSFAFLAIDSLALTTIHIPAFLLWNLGALPVTDNTTLLGRNILTDLILNGLTLLLIDNLALSFSSSRAFLFVNRIALVLIGGCALLVLFSPALLFMNSLRDSSWNIDTLQLRDIVTFFILHSAALLPGVLSSLAFLPILDLTLLTRDRLLNRSLGDLTLALLNISTDGIGNISTLLLGDGLIRGLGDLVTHLLGNLSTDWGFPLDWR